jgi:NAD(P)-dependent dehydrogenase (short-subunit alcohol dehydrogenase family)
VAARLMGDGDEVIGLVRSEVSLRPAGLAETWTADLSAPDRLESMLAGHRCGAPLDGIVHAAGVARPGPVADSGAPAWQAMEEQFRVNAVAIAELTRLVLPSLIAGSTVVLINSGSGLNARAPLGSYAMSKFALRAYADLLRSEASHVRVSSLYLGPSATDMQQALQEATGGTYRPEKYIDPTTVAEVVSCLLRLPADAVVADVTLRPSGPAHRGSRSD